MQKVCEGLVEGPALRSLCFSLRGGAWTAWKTKSIPTCGWAGVREVYLPVDLEKGAIWFLILFGTPSCSVPEMVILRSHQEIKVPNPQVGQAVGKFIQNPRVLQVSRNWTTDFCMKKRLQETLRLGWCGRFSWRLEIWCRRLSMEPLWHW